MVPRYLELRDVLPKSPSEKVQKHKLIEADARPPRGPRRSSRRAVLTKTLDAYFAGVNEDRFDDVAALFTPDATLTAPGVGPLEHPTRSRPTWPRR